jgi:hypothetical protein
MSTKPLISTLLLAVAALTVAGYLVQSPEKATVVGRSEATVPKSRVDAIIAAISSKRVEKLRIFIAPESRVRTVKTVLYSHEVFEDKTQSAKSMLAQAQKQKGFLWEFIQMVSHTKFLSLKGNTAYIESTDALTDIRDWNRIVFRPKGNQWVVSELWLSYHP